MPIPDNLKTALKIINKLSRNGYEAYFVGGSVRDMYMRRAPKDYDILTTATPRAIKKLFKRTIPVGEKFGVIIVRENNTNYEVATARLDGIYKDSRHPENVSFCSVEEDIKRRDFTVNALLYDPLKKTYIDFVNGKRDIKRKVIRTVGSPDKRFKEDALRMLRAIRFSVRLQFAIDPATFSAIKKLSPAIKEISAERVKDELVKMIETGRFTQALILLDKSGLLKQILPEISALKGVRQPAKFHPEGDVFKHTLLTIQNLKQKKDTVSVLSALLHDVGKPATFRLSDRIRFYGHDRESARLSEEILRRLRFSNQIIGGVSDICGNHMYFIEVRRMRIAKLKRLIMKPLFQVELDLHRADCLASHGDISNYRFLVKKMKEYGNLKTLPNPLVTGKDLISMGYTPGPVFKEILSDLSTAVLENEISNKDEAVLFIKRKYPVAKMPESPVKL